MLLLLVAFVVQRLPGDSNNRGRQDEEENQWEGSGEYSAGETVWKERMVGVCIAPCPV